MGPFQGCWFEPAGDIKATTPFLHWMRTDNYSTATDHVPHLGVAQGTKAKETSESLSYMTLFDKKSLTCCTTT
jgi:hypothetical protein